MYNNANNNMNPLFTLLEGLMPGGGSSGGQPQQPSGGGQQGAGQQGGGGIDQSNPLVQLLAAMMSGQNPMNALTHILPQAAQMAQNRGGQNMEQFVRNEYNRQGVDINAAMQQLQQLMNAMNANQNGGQGGYNTPGSGQNGYNAGQGGYNTGGNTNGGYGANNTNNGY